MATPLVTEVEVQASPEEVWQLLVAVPRWPEWARGVQLTLSEIQVSARGEMMIDLSSGGRLAFPVKLTALVGARRLQLTHCGFRALFLRRKFDVVLTEGPDQKTQIRTSLATAGPLARLPLLAAMTEALKPGMEAFGQSIAQKLGAVKND